jgi:AcrR family transcriptional regulator
MLALGSLKVLRRSSVEKLSGAYDTQSAGLPRGRTSLLTEETRDKQRRRLVKAAISAFAEKGFTATTITDIVKRARVSKQAFYEIFENKEDCFLAADDLGRKALYEQVLTGIQAESLHDDHWIRSSVHAYLQLCVSEQEFTKAWAIEFPNAGRRCLEQHNLFFAELGKTLKSIHNAIKFKQPERWVTVPDLFYDAAIGGAYGIIFRYICQNRFDELLDLEDDLVHFIQFSIGFKK